MRLGWAYPVGRLEADHYTVPRGAYGIIDMELSSGDLAIRWLPPHTGVSVPVARDDLADAGEFVLPEHLWPENLSRLPDTVSSAVEGPTRCAPAPEGRENE